MSEKDKIVYTDDAECGQLTQEAMQKVIDQWGNVGFKVPAFLGTSKSGDNPLEKMWREMADPKLGVPHTIPVQKLYDVASREPIESYGRPALRTDSVESETVYRHRDSYMLEFFAYETVAAPIIHTTPLVKIDRDQNPEWFAALDEALAAGTAVIDEHGTLWVRPDPKDYPDRPGQFVKDSMAFEAALRRSKPPAPLPDEEIGPDIVVEAKDGSAQLEHRVAQPQRPAELPPR